MKRIHSSAAIIVLLTGGIWGALAACGSGGGGSTFNNNEDGSTGPLFGTDAVFAGPWSDFPKEPIIDSSDGGAVATPESAAALFASGTSGGGDGSSPCLSEPEVGSLVPRNWLRPRFRWTAATATTNIFEIHVHADNQVNDLRVYTTAPEWTMPQAMWIGLSTHSAGVPITVSVRGGRLNAGAVTEVTQGSKGPWTIAPVEAPGSIVYWHIVGGGAADLKGFVVGDETVRPTLAPAKVEQQPNAQCVGCHIASPDGKYAIFSSDDFGGGGNYGLGIASVEPATEGKKPAFLTSQGEAALETYVKGVSTASAAYWTEGKHLVVASQDGQIRWVNLDGTDAASVKGVVQLTGDTHTKPNSPNLAHDGSRLVYVSGNAEDDGRPKGAGNDVFVVPFNGGLGGAAAGLNGAATAEFNEYYPSFSPDDKLVAFNRVPANEDPYSNAHAEVYVIASGGGAPQRLAANDPPACSGKKSPGVENSWPKWAPAAPNPVTVDGRTYYWLVFSSTRFGGGDRQLFMAPVVVEANGTITPYKAVYLWNQPADEKNHTPAWDVFQIPPSSPK